MDLFEPLTPEELALVDQLKSEVQHIVQVGFVVVKGFVEPGSLSGHALMLRAFSVVILCHIAWSAACAASTLLCAPWDWIESRT